MSNENRLEKKYERLDLSSNLNNNNLRDLYTLKKSFKYVLEKYNENNDYSYIISQLKSIRQELIIQKIKDNFVIEVYEKSVELSIENNDIPNFNVSISYLINDLYPFIPNKNFIKFYRYYLIYNSIYDIKDLSVILKTNNFKENKKELKDILNIIKIINEKNYIKLIVEISKLKSEKEKKLFENYFPKIKLLSLILMCYGYFTTIPIKFIQEKLLFKNEKTCVNFLKENNAILDEEEKNFLCRNSIKNLLDNKLLIIVE